ncbi:hypothetical protein A7E77_00095 [Sphingomonas sp. NIC1]|nr:hypothetical protein A7E77_00095 [Sphingomonas sp. NIC1]
MNALRFAMPDARWTILMTQYLPRTGHVGRREGGFQASVCRIDVTHEVAQRAFQIPVHPFQIVQPIGKELRGGPQFISPACRGGGA